MNLNLNKVVISLKNIAILTLFTALFSFHDTAASCHASRSKKKITQTGMRKWSYKENRIPTYCMYKELKPTLEMSPIINISHGVKHENHPQVHVTQWRLSLTVNYNNI